MKRKLHLALLASSALLLGLTAAQANFIEIGVALNSTVGGPVSTVASGEGTASVSGAVLGPFTIDASAMGSPPLTGNFLLDGKIRAVSTGGGPANIVLDVVITETGISPVGLSRFNALVSSFTQNLLTAGWVVIVDTFVDNTNAAYGTQQLVGQAGFTTSDQTSVDLNSANFGAGPFSLTVAWFISPFSSDISLPARAGQTNNTTDIEIVPGPEVGAGLPGLAMLLGYGGWWWRRRNKLAA